MVGGGKDDVFSEKHCQKFFSGKLQATTIENIEQFCLYK
jgi:hypothetical protein